MASSGVYGARFFVLLVLLRSLAVAAPQESNSAPPAPAQTDARNPHAVLSRVLGGLSAPNAFHIKRHFLKYRVSREAVRDKLCPERLVSDSYSKLRRSLGELLVEPIKRGELSLFVCDRGTSGVFEAHWNPEGELDCATYWCREFVIETNPGRKRVSFRIARRPCTVCSLASMMSPLPVKATAEELAFLKVLEPPRADRRTIFRGNPGGRLEQEMLIVTRNDLPVIGAVYVKGDLRLLTYLVFADTKDGECRLAEICRVSIAPDASAPTESSVALERHELSFADSREHASRTKELRLSVRPTDRVFQLSEFRGASPTHVGMAKSVTLPHPVRAVLDVTENPTPLWLQ